MYRIAIDARPLSFPTTGIGRYTRAIISRLIEREWDWYLYSDRPLLWPELPPSNVKIRHPAFMPPAAGSVFSQIAYPIWCWRDKVDLFWSPRHHLPLMLGGDVRSVVTVHDLVWKHFPGTMSRFGRLLDAGLMPPSIRKADRVISVSDSTTSEILSVSSCATVATIYEAPFLELADEIQDGNYFLFVGTLEPRKNLSTLLKAYRLYADSCGGALPLKICGGKGWGLPALQQLISELNLQDKVMLMGYVSDAELPDLYRNARALLMPSLYEGFGLPIVEAYSQNTPVITSDRGAMREVAGEAALLVDPECQVEISRALTQLTVDSSALRALQRAAHQRAQHFSWDKAARETLELMESLLACGD
ncbi:glycosyltransferase family 4 protein [Microbulbifer marinus]|uniref:Glycosyltransferase involved in cell wall bisynthesis n=1 Tax=Microbulbifer marinus TaxID=658218 RepID=A0A1H3VXU1_9GAMM|nr:glycosyltransferase family 1 protein [Microbulbifer marinus]SDZ78868.1 Glycosyltransferase involved in cell wall bisynthesis [Microbulbifer marinus]